MKAMFGTYFRGEVRGLENIPAEGPALLTDLAARRRHVIQAVLTCE